MTDQWQPLARWALLKRGSGVYVIRNRVSNREYVGISIEMRERLRRHSKAETVQRLHKAIQKHGLDQFEVSVRYLKLSREELTALEIQLIAERGTYASGGYNDTRGGDGGWEGLRHSEESLRKMRGRPATRGTTGWIPSAETRALISAGNRGKSYRPVISAEARERALRSRDLSNALGRNVGQAPVLCWPIGSLTPMEFVSVAAAARYAGVSVVTLRSWIQKPLKNRTRYLGPVWAYEADLNAGAGL